MVAKYVVLIFVCFLNLKGIHPQEQNTRKVSGADVILNSVNQSLTLNYCLSIVQQHWMVEMIDAMKNLNESISSISIMKQEIVDEIKSQLTETQDVIVTENQRSISESERTILDQLTIEKDAIIAENERLALDVKEVLTNELTTAKEELATEIENIKNQLTVNEEAIADIQLKNPLPTDCRDLQRRGATSSGVYRIKPRAATNDFLVFCDFNTREGGWTYIVNRIDGTQDFYLDWADYKIGFGDISGEHWLGLDNLYALTNSEPYELLFDLVHGNSLEYYALYDNFRIGPESDGYPIVALGSYNGDAQDAFTYHNNMKFSTRDRDQDAHPTSECAITWRGGWWYRSCVQAHLTGTHKAGSTNTILWTYLSSLDQARMMIRPRRV